MVEALIATMIFALFLGSLIVSFGISLDKDGFACLAFPLCIVIWFGIFVGVYAENEKNITQKPQVTYTQQVDNRDESQLLEEKLEKLKSNRKIDSLKAEISKLEGGK